MEECRKCEEEVGRWHKTRREGEEKRRKVASRSSRNEEVPGEWGSTGEYPPERPEIVMLLDMVLCSVLYTLELLGLWCSALGVLWYIRW